MEKAKRNLKSISIILIVIGVFSLIASIVSIVSPSGAFTAAAMMELNGYSIDEANIAVITFIAGAAIGFLLELFVGLKGIIVANGGKRSKLVTIIVAINIILLVLGASSSAGYVIAGKMDLIESQVILQVCELILFIYYIVYVNKVISLRKTTV